MAKRDKISKGNVDDVSRISYNSSNYGGCVAIDLGTTNSVVTYVTPDGECKLIENNLGDYLTPSYAWFEDNPETQNLENASRMKVTVGKKAKEHMLIDPENVVCQYKPDMGKSRTCKVVQLSTGAAKVTPEVCSKLVLQQLIKDVSTSLGSNITDVVITVPARFSDPQRNATKLCAEALNLNVLGIISEPTAAAFYYGLEGSGEETKTILAYDFGGGTFDASIIGITGTQGVVIGTHGDTHLGGGDIDKELAQLLCKKIFKSKKVFTDLPVSQQEILIQKAEKFKIQLSNLYDEHSNDSNISSQSVTDTIELTVEESEALSQDITVKFSEYSKILTPFIEKTMRITFTMVEQLINEGTISADDITDVLLIGGSSRLPLIREMLIDRLEELNISTPTKRFDAEYFSRYLVDPDLSVSLGAGYYLKALRDDTGNVGIVDIVPLPIGVEIFDNVTNQLKMDTIVHRGSSLPARSTAKTRFTNVVAGQTDILVNVYEGTSLFTSENVKLGTIILTITPEQAAIPGSVSISIRINVDKDGIITVKCSDLTNRTQVQSVFSRGDVVTELEMSITESNVIALNDDVTALGQIGNDKISAIVFGDTTTSSEVDTLDEELESKPKKKTKKTAKKTNKDSILSNNDIKDNAQTSSTLDKLKGLVIDDDDF